MWHSVEDKRFFRLQHLLNVGENTIYFYNPQRKKWEKKVSTRFVINASSSQVRQSTSEAGSGIWASILETDDADAPPVKKIAVLNRSVHVKDGSGKRQSPALDDTNNAWVDSGNYTIYYRSEPVFRAFAGGSE